MKDMLGTKGARLSTDLSIPSRYFSDDALWQSLGVSQRIESEAERDRLRSMIERIQAEHKLPGSVIVRTAADRMRKLLLHKRWLIWQNFAEFIQRKQISIAVPSLIFEELPLPQRIIRDLASEKTAKIPSRLA